MSRQLRSVCCRLERIAALLAALLCCVSAARAETNEPFKGKTVTLYIGTPVGGGYDVYGRLLARHLGDHLPGRPAVVPTNMGGGPSLICANFLYNLAPRDGTAIGIVEQNIAEGQIFGTDGVRFDAAKFGWIGRMSSNVEFTYVWHDVPVNSIEDVKTREVIFGVFGATEIYPTMLNSMVGTRFKLVRGYPGSQATNLALESGEVQGTVSAWSTIRSGHPDWLDDHKIKILMQHMVERSPELPDVPTVVEIVKRPEDKDVATFFASGGMIGRSFIAPPNLPPDVLQALRDGFDATMRDPQLLAEAKQMKVEIDPLPGATVQGIVERSLALPEAARERAREFRWR